MPIEIQVEGLEPLQQRFSQFASQYKRAEKKALDASMLVLHENVPSYPPPPETSTYKRTGLLGRTLGASETGGIEGKPEIYEVKQGSGMSEGRFGTRLWYAPRVIGEKQSEPWSSYWWNIKTIAEKSKGKIERLWHIMAEELARWLEGR